MEKKQSVLFVAEGMNTKPLINPITEIPEKVAKAIEAAKANFKDEWKNGIVYGTSEIEEIMRQEYELSDQFKRLNK